MLPISRKPIRRCPGCKQRGTDLLYYPVDDRWWHYGCAIKKHGEKFIEALDPALQLLIRNTNIFQQKKKQ